MLQLLQSDKSMSIPLLVREAWSCSLCTNGLLDALAGTVSASGKGRRRGSAFSCSTCVTCHGLGEQALPQSCWMAKLWASPPVTATASLSMLGFRPSRVFQFCALGNELHTAAADAEGS